MNLKALSNQELTLNLEAAATRERRATVEVIAHIHEFMVRRLYLEYGCTSLFAYLTTHLHFSEATAQNRIDAARLLNETPELAEKISSGTITLTQVSVVAQAMRLKRRELKTETGTSTEREDRLKPAPLSLFSAIEGLDSKKSAVLVARELDISPVTHEKARPQQDESVRLEITLSKEEWAKLRQARDLLSHRNPNASMADVIAEVTRYFVRREDPKLAGTGRSKNRQTPKTTSDPKLPAELAEAEKKAAEDHSESSNRSSVDHEKRSAKRVAIPAATRRLVFARDLYCQWTHSATGHKCKSTFLLQIDHRVSVCAGGSNEPDNLQLLCATHNRWKFEHA